MEMELGLLAKRKLFSLIKNGVRSSCSSAQAARALFWEEMAFSRIRRRVQLQPQNSGPAPRLCSEPAASAILQEGRWFEES